MIIRRVPQQTGSIDTMIRVWDEMGNSHQVSVKGNWIRTPQGYGHKQWTLTLEYEGVTKQISCGSTLDSLNDPVSAAFGFLWRDPRLFIMSRDLATGGRKRTVGFGTWSNYVLPEVFSEEEGKLILLTPPSNRYPDWSVSVSPELARNIIQSDLPPHMKTLAEMVLRADKAQSTRAWSSFFG